MYVMQQLLKAFTVLQVKKRKVLMLIYLNGVYVDDCLEIMDAWVLDVLVLCLSFSLSINELVLDILEGC